MHTYIIAEAGVNHNGDPQKAFRLIDIASSCSADAVKFQTFKTEKLVTKNARTASYQKKSTKSLTQFEMLKNLELPESIHFELLDYAKEKSIDFMSTAFDSDSLRFLVHDLGLSKLKISSGDITNEPFLLEHAQTGSEIIISTGASTMDEIENALSALAYGFLEKSKTRIKRAEFREAYLSKEGQKSLRENVTILHCVSEYPAPKKELNLKTIKAIKERFNIPVGYSDHSTEITAPMIAVALGSSVIEKHFTLDKKLDGPDHQASLDKDELEKTINLIRLSELMLGDGKKVPSSSELKNQKIIRKSLFAKTDIKKGQEYTLENIAIMRPAEGMNPSNFWEIIGRVASHDLEKGEPIIE